MAISLNFTSRISPVIACPPIGRSICLDFQEHSMPKDVGNLILGHLSSWDQIKITGVCKNWHEFIFISLQAQFSKGLLFSRVPVRVIGVSEWRRCFGEEDLINQKIDLTDIPLNTWAAIVRIAYINARSGIKEDAGVTVLHTLEGLTLKKLVELARKRFGNDLDLKISEEILDGFGDIPIGKNCIEVLTNNVLKGTTNISVQAQQARVKKFGCELPGILSFASLAILTSMIGGTPLFRNNSLETSTRCREWIDKKRVIIVGVVPRCLYIYIRTHVNDLSGAAGSVEVPALAIEHLGKSRLKSV